METKKIFISYGHGKYNQALQQLANDLRNSVGKYQVFFDADLLNGGDLWEEKIRNHIEGADVFLFFASTKSVSATSYCLNELTTACEAKVKILPILMEEVKIPMSINTIQRINLIGHFGYDNLFLGKQYTIFLNELISIIEGNIIDGYATSDENLRKFLRYYEPTPSDFDPDDFYGRELAFAKLDEFLKSKERIILYTAAPGTGKTSFSRMIEYTYKDTLAARYFIDFACPEFCKQKGILCSIAYQLSHSIQGYRDKLYNNRRIDSNFYDSSSIQWMFQTLFIECFRDIELTSDVVILIDSLDEASIDGKNEMCDVIAENLDKLNPRIKFIFTSRYEDSITHPFQDKVVLFELTKEMATNDLSKFYRKKIPNLTDYQLNVLLSKSENSFLYAQFILKRVEEKPEFLLELKEWPTGIYSFFENCFDRIFGTGSKQISNYEPVKNIIELLCIASTNEYKEQITKADLLDYLKTLQGIGEIETTSKIDIYYINRLLTKIKSFFEEKDKGVIVPYHKAVVEWLMEKGKSNYSIMIEVAESKLLKYVNQVYKRCKEATNANKVSFEANRFLLKYYISLLTYTRENCYCEAITILNDLAFINARIGLLGFDVGIGTYISDIKVLNSKNNSNSVALFKEETFRDIFSKNRRLFYNSGFLFELKKMSFDQAIENDNSWDLLGETGKAFYYFVAEEFELAIKKSEFILKNKAFKKELNDCPSLRVELYNNKGVSERKLGLLKDAYKSFTEACKLASSIKLVGDSFETDIAYERSLSYMVMSKIDVNFLRFDLAKENMERALKILEDSIEYQQNNRNIASSDRLISNIMFIAEEYRVYAVHNIWNGKFDFAASFLSKTNEIYNENYAASRYQIRYNYTLAFLYILSHKSDVSLDKLKTMLKETASEYDKGRIYFLMALEVYINHSDELELYPSALVNISKSLEYFGSNNHESNSSIDRPRGINAVVEYAEAKVLYDLIKNSIDNTSNITVVTNKEIKQWVEHVRKVFTDCRK